MPSVPHESSNQAPSSLSQMARSLCLGWHPWAVGLATFILFVLPMLATIWNVHNRANTMLKQALHQHLLGAARTLALTVDADLHPTFVDPSQEASEAYQKEIEQLERVKLALDPNSIIQFVYTCVAKDDEVRFVLDITPAGDHDQDGVDDKAHVMEVYESPNATLRKVLRTGLAEVAPEPYQDRWGSFISGYAPIFDRHHAMVGVAGVDIELSEYHLQLSGVRHVAILSALAALSLSFVAGLGVAAYHRRLQRSVSLLVGANDAALAAVRAKSDFLAAMSHELRTPMNAVLGMTELLKDTALNSTQTSFVETIQQSGETLLAKITDILDFSQFDVGELAAQQLPVDLGTLVSELSQHFQAPIQAKGLNWVTEIEPTCPPQFLGDAIHLKQLLRHLIGNAIQFTSQGTITLSARVEQVKGEEATLHLKVIDTGLGMSAEQQGQLFEPFFQGDRSTTRRQGGTGMGLALCKRICSGLQGSIVVESQLGVGSTFHVTLPIRLISSQPSQKVLIFSQDRTTQLLVTRVAEKAGHQPHLETAQDALLETLQRDRFDCLLIDAVGCQVAELPQVLAFARGARLILINAPPGQAASGVFDAVLESPLKPAQLREILQ
jgi:signal transduction histidine kinase